MISKLRIDGGPPGTIGRRRLQEKRKKKRSCVRGGQSPQGSVTLIGILHRLTAARQALGEPLSRNRSPPKSSESTRRPGFYVPNGEAVAESRPIVPIREYVSTDLGSVRATPRRGCSGRPSGRPRTKARTAGNYHQKWCVHVASRERLRRRASLFSTLHTSRPFSNGVFPAQMQFIE